MTLYYTNTYGNFYVPVGTVLKLSPTFVPAAWNGWTWEPVAGWLTSSLMTVGSFPVPALLRQHDQRPTPLRIPIVPTKPARKEYDSEEDWRNYGTRISGIDAALKLIRQGTTSMFDPEGENPGYHVSYRGEVGPQTVDQTLWEYGGPWYSFWGFQFPQVLTRNGYLLGDYSRNPFDTIAGVGDIGGPVFDRYRRSGTSPLWPVVTHLVPHLEHIKGRLGADWRIDFQTYTKTSLRLFGFDYEASVDGRHVRVYFNVEGTTRDWGHAYPTIYCRQVTQEVEYSFDFYPENLQPPDHDFVHGQYDKIQSVGRLEVTRNALITGTYSYWNDNPKPWLGIAYHHQYTETNFCLANKPTKVDEEVQSTEGMFKAFKRADLITDFRHQVNKVQGDIRLSALLSTSDALQGTDIDTNVLEALYELKGIAELIPDFSALLDAVKDFAAGRILHTLRDMVDFATSLKLQMSFGVNPTVDFFVAVIPRLGELWATLASGLDERKVITHRGTYTFAFPNWEFGREFSYLTTRTLVRHYQKPSSVFAIVKALGLAPIPSNFWDILPMSFVVDWMTGLRERIVNIEGLVTFLEMDVIHLVHTFRVDSPLSASELTKFGMVTNNLGVTEPEPIIRWFVRDVSRHFPKTGVDGRYDFAQPQRPPPWEISGSLAFQILFGRGSKGRG